MIDPTSRPSGAAASPETAASPSSLPELTGPSPALIGAVRRVLTPLVLILVRFGVTFPNLAALLKGLYVDVAERHFALEEKPLSDSRVTLLTGVHRKDVSRLRGRPVDEALDEMTPTLAAQVIGRWLADPAYQLPRDPALSSDPAVERTTGEGQASVTARGTASSSAALPPTPLAGSAALPPTPLAVPRPLPRTDKAARDLGLAVSFESLVSAISRDLRPRAVLDELLHAGLVEERAEDGLLTLVRTAHLPRNDLDQMAFYLGRNIGDHMAATAHNLTGHRPPFLERAVFHDGLTPRSIAALREEAERMSMVVLMSLNERAHALAAQDAGDAQARHRFTAGVYVFASDPAAPADRADPPGPTDPPPGAGPHRAPDPAQETRS